MTAFIASIILADVFQMQYDFNDVKTATWLD